MDKQPLVSVVVPTYNVAGYLHQCLDSIVAQSHVHLEILVVDDGSTDESGHIADEWASHDPRIKVTHQPHAGLSAARNTALDQAQGEYITCIDSDDFVHPHYIERLHQALTTTYADMAVGDFQVVSDSYPHSFPQLPQHMSLKVFSRDEAINAVFYQKHITHSAWGRLYKRELFDGIRYPVDKVYEDIAVIYPILMKVERVVTVKDKLYYYMQRPGSIIGTFTIKHIGILDILDDLEKRVEIENPKFLAPVRNRKLSANFNILLKCAAHGNQFKPQMQRSWMCIKKLRLECLFDPHIRLKNLTGILLSFLGRTLFLNLPLVKWLYKSRYSAPQQPEMKNEGGEPPLISVISPIYNVADFLSQCLRSIVRQTYSNLEILLIDDGSDDNSLAIAQEWAAHDPRIKVVGKKHSGQSDTRNMALDLCQGEYLTFVDSDDFIAPQFIENLYALATQYNCDVAICDWVEFSDEQGAPPMQEDSKSPFLKIYNKQEVILNILYQKKLNNSPCSRLFKTKVFKDIRFKSGHIYEDLAIVIPCFENTKKTIYTDQKMYFYRHHASSTMGRFSIKRADVLAIMDDMEVMAREKYPQYVNAVKSRKLSASFNMLRLIPLSDPQYREIVEKCWNNIKRLRLSCLLNPHVRIINKVGILISFLGQKILTKFINGR